MDPNLTRRFKSSLWFGLMTMIYNAIFFTLYDRITEGYVDTRILFLTCILGFISGIFAYSSILITGLY